jgi:glutathione S-transferase
MWGNATMHPAYSRYFWLSRNVQDEAQRQALLTAAANNIQSLWDDADQQLAKTAFLAGDTLTMGDILMAVIANWSTSLIQPIQFGEHVKRVIRQVISRPAYQKALSVESVEYKVAA